MKDLWIPVFWIAVIGGIWLSDVTLPFQSEITVYRLFCTGERKDGRCNGKEETAIPTTYKVFPDLQTVIHWTGDPAVTRRLRHCAVRNAKNWTCQLGNKLEDDPVYQYQMINGEFIDVVPDRVTSISQLFYQVSKMRWWLVWLEEKTR